MLSKMQWFWHYYTMFFHFNPMGFIFIHFFLLCVVGAWIEQKIYIWRINNR